MAEAVAPRAGVSPLLAASLAAGLGYPLLWNVGLDASALVALRAAGVGLLAWLAARQARSTDGRLLVLLLLFGALGDVLLEVRFEAGIAAFAAGHITSIMLYGRNRRAATTASQKGLAVALLLFGVAMPLLLLGSDDPRLTGLTIYSLLLTAMAAAAWLSRFPRYRTGLGAVLFVLSDTLIAARMEPLAGAVWIGYAIGLLYYAGQLLIFLGVSRTLCEGGDRR